MDKGRLIAVGALWTVLIVGLTLDPQGHVGTEDEESEEWQRFSARCSSDSLRTISQAEPDFIANDDALSHVNDFWTLDVGLYDLVNAGSTDDAIRLIELSISSADEDEGWTPEKP